MNDDLPPDVQGLIELARADVPGDVERARMKRSVLGQVAGSVAVASTVVASSAAASTTNFAVATAAGTKLGPLVGIALWVAAGGLAAGGAIAVREHYVARGEALHAAPSTSLTSTPNRTSAASDPQEPQPTTQTVVPSLPLAAPAAAPSAAVLPRAAGAHRADGPSTSTLEVELPLLREAQEALRAGDPARALTYLNEHARRFPNGELAQERAAAHAIASCKLDARRGRAEADAFVTMHAASPLADRVREACDRSPSRD
jgi:hypothetical protein